MLGIGLWNGFSLWWQLPISCLLSPCRWRANDWCTLLPGIWVEGFGRSWRARCFESLARGPTSMLCQRSLNQRLPFYSPIIVHYLLLQRVVCDWERGRGLGMASNFGLQWSYVRGVGGRSAHWHSIFNYEVNSNSKSTVKWQHNHFQQFRIC